MARWTEAKTAELRRLLEDHVDRNEIARRLNVTPSALSGKVKRLGLSSGTHATAQERRAQVASYNQRHRRRAPPKPPSDDQTARAIERAVYECDYVGVEDLLTLTERPEDGCCFPVGDPREDTRVYCPNKKVPCASYCEYHLTRVYSLDDEPKVARAQTSGRAAREREVA